MSCNKPNPAWYSDKLTDSGKRPLTFNGKDRYTGSDPRYVSSLWVPCGKCSGCKADQSLMWAIRCYHESTLHDENCFITLTYDDAHLPADGKIDKTVLQKFFRRLRKSGLQVRYMACGEYGDRTDRPHYHAIIFGKDWLEGAIPVTDKLYTHDSLMKIWGKGLISIAPVTMASICYVCGYVTKKISNEDTFNLMSRRPGLGHDWLDKFKDDILRTGIVVIEGKEYQVPKRYLLWYEEFFDEVKKARAAHAKQKNSGVDPIDRHRRQDNREINKNSRISFRQTKEVL